jgi:NAD(P)-dependent dehydrogenase (short-subunit alcohol dehydrogenase family)
MRDDLDLAGLRALVTGGTKGIGEAVVVRLREAGAKVLMPCRVFPADADAIELVSLKTSSGPRCTRLTI